MNFFEPELNVIASSDGWSIKVLGRAGLKYTQGDKHILIDSEIMAVHEPYAMIIDGSSIEEWVLANEQTSVVSNTERKQIAKNIIDAFLFKGHKVEMVGVKVPNDNQNI